MNISASIINEDNHQIVAVQTNGNMKNLSIPPKASGNGSSVNGGELLCLALATCFCNDLYREAKKMGIKVKKVTVEAWSEFGSEGEPGRGFQYRAQVDADASDEDIALLIGATDRVAEIQNTLRMGVPVALVV